MKNRTGYIFSTFLLIVGLYRGYHAACALLMCLLEIPMVINILQGKTLISILGGLDLYAFEFVQTIFIFVFSVLCIYISLKRVQWKHVLCCGIIGVMGYVISCIYIIYLKMLTFNNALALLRLSLIPICIIIFSCYYRAYPMTTFYRPIPVITLMKKMLTKMKINFKAKK